MKNLKSILLTESVADPKKLKVHVFSPYAFEDFDGEVIITDDMCTGLLEYIDNMDPDGEYFDGDEYDQIKNDPKSYGKTLDQILKEAMKDISKGDYYSLS